MAKRTCEHILEYFNINQLFLIMKQLRSIFFYALVPFALTVGCNQQEEGWEPLFNGEDLSNFEKLNGEATYAIEDDAIVGTSTLNTPNTFLTTKEKYGDFILEVDIKVDTLLNSGIQIRSNSYDTYRDGRVHGYQVEIDPSDRAWSGGIYDEARRGWLNNLADNPEARAAFNNNDWNHYRIEAIGDTIKTWVNDVPAAYLIDDLTDSGFIGLQVHDIEMDTARDGTQVRWKNIRIMTDSALVAKNSTDPGIEPIIIEHNVLTEEEKAEGYMLLWDGETTEGWRNAYAETFPEMGWSIEDGMLIVEESGGGEAENGGDIVTVDEYDNFDLTLAFKITEGANSGIKYYVTEEQEGVKGSAIGLEYQILDDARHPDAKKGNHEGSRTLASLYDLIKAEGKDYFPPGNWNTARLVSTDSIVEHYLNGKKVLSYERGSENYKQLVAGSKYKVWDDFGMAEQGHLLLQDHGNRVYFRNIKIKEIE